MESEDTTTVAENNDGYVPNDNGSGDSSNIFKALDVNQEIEEFISGRQKSTEDISDKANKVEPEKLVEADNNSKKPLGLDDFNKILPPVHNKNEKTKSESKEEENNNAEGKNEGQDKNNPAKSQNQTPGQQTVKPRVLDGFGDKEKIWLQRMPYDAYEHFSKEVKSKRELESKITELTKTHETEVAKLKEGKVTIPDSYYEHQNAAWLSPEVQTLNDGVKLAGEIENHWKKQLLAIEQGKEWFDLIEDPKTGQIYVDNKPQPAGETGSDMLAGNKINLMANYQQSLSQKARVTAELQSFVGGFQTRHKELIGKIKSAEDQFMPMFKDEASEEYKQLDPIKKELSKFGLSKDHPAFNMLAKSVALNFILKELYVFEKNKKATAESIKQDQRKAGPTASSLEANGSADKGSNSVNLDGFSKFGLTPVR